MFLLYLLWQISTPERCGFYLIYIPYPRPSLATELDKQLVAHRRLEVDGHDAQESRGRGGVFVQRGGDGESAVSPGGKVVLERGEVHNLLPTINDNFRL